MNKKYNFLVGLLIFFSFPTIFAAQNIDMEQYKNIASAYDRGYLAQIKKDTDIQVVQAHKEMLEKRKEIIESSYMPILFKIIASGLGGGAFVGLGIALYGAVGSYFLLNQSDSLADMPRLGYFDFVRYIYPKLLSTHSEKPNWDIQGKIFDKRGQYTVSSFDNSSDLQKGTLVLGIGAPPLAAVGLVMATISRYLFNKASSYKEEAAQLEKQIEKDDAILKVMGVVIFE